MERNFTSVWMDFASQLIARQKEKLSHNRLSIYGVIFLLSVIVFYFTDHLEAIQSDPEANFLLAFTFVSVFNFAGVFTLVLLTFLIQNSESHHSKIQEIIDSLSKYFLELPFTILIISLCLANLFDGFLARSVGLGRAPYFAYVLFWTILGGVVFLHIRKGTPTIDFEKEVPDAENTRVPEQTFRRRLFGLLLLLSSILLILSFMAFGDLVTFSGLFKKLVFLKASFLLTLFLYLSGFLLFLLSADYAIGDFKKIERKLLLENYDEDDIRLFYIGTCFEAPLKEWVQEIIPTFSELKKDLVEGIEKVRIELEKSLKEGKGKDVVKKEKLLIPLKEKFQLLEEATKPVLERVPQIIRQGFFINQSEFLSDFQLIISGTIKKLNDEINAL